MKERPILFTGPMVRALLAGTKTQTRRIVKPQPPRGVYNLDGKGLWFTTEQQGVSHGPFRCPYGQPGDRLWVREAWREWSEAAWHYAADGLVLPKQRDRALASFLAQRAPFTWESYKWRPSIHMPRAASRITLEVTGVRVERLQSITNRDALAEGIVKTHGGYGLPDGSHFHCAAPSISYTSLFESINGPGSVEADPWVWVVEFKRIEQ